MKVSKFISNKAPEGSYRAKLYEQCPVTLGKGAPRFNELRKRSESPR